MNERRGSRQFQPEERVLLAAYAREGASVRETARRLGRCPGTVSRELRRNGVTGAGYASKSAQVAATRRRIAARPAAKPAPDSLLLGGVTALLDWRWSPPQIAGTLRRMWPYGRDRHLSHETICTAIYAPPKSELRRALIAWLRQGRSKRKRRSRGEDRRGHLLDAISIHVRRSGVDDHLMPDHWEGDLIKGAANRSAVAVLVERQTRLEPLAKVPDAAAASAMEDFSTKLRSIAAPMRKTFTYDQGKEMALHTTLAEQSGVNVYFCDPHSPRQRRTCENTNGLLRQHLPEGTNLSVHSQADLDAIADSLNGRPRATHDFRLPIEVFSEMTKKLEPTPPAIH